MSRVTRLLPALFAAFLPSLARAQGPAPACATPDSIAVSGAVRIPIKQAKADAGIKEGDTLNYRLLQRAIKNAFATGNYDDIQVHCDVNATNGRTTLQIHLVERPLLASVTVSGGKVITNGSIRQKIDLPTGRPVDPALIARSVAQIDSAYHDKGYFLVKVKVDSVVADGHLKLSYNVHEGRRLAIASVQLIGNKKVKMSTIIAALDTKPEGFLWFQDGAFDEDKEAADVGEHLENVYLQRGYIDFQVLKDTVVVDPETGKGILRITVHEGPKYLVGSFEIIGNRHFSTEELRLYYPFTGEGPSITARMLSVVKGELPDPHAFNEVAWDVAVGHVREAYSNEGYIYATVRSVIDRVTLPDSSHIANLRWEIEEKNPATINRIDIVGNDYTRESCIRQQLVILPGDVFNQDRLLRSYQQIQNMGFFESPLPPPDTRPANEQGDVDIVFRVKEKKTGTINFGASVGQGTGVGGFIGLDQPNLFGTCKRGSLQWQFGRYANNFQLGYTDPSLNYTRISMSIAAYHTSTQYIVANLGTSISTGGSVQFGFPVRGSPYTRFFVSYGAEGVRFSGGVAVRDTNVNTNQNFRSTVGLTLTHDNRVDMPFPSGGSMRTVSLQLNGGPLGGTAEFERLGGEVRFYNTLLTVGGGTPMGQPIKLVTGLTGRTGLVFGDTGPFFYSQLFTMGGTQYGEMLRGYPSFSITPHGYAPGSTQNAQVASFGGAFFSMTAELGLRFNAMVYPYLFFDAGNVYAEPRDFDPTRLFRGAGFGISIVTPLGPLGLDYGYGFDRLNAFLQPAPAWQLHFRLGNIFQ
jgi:outer membrane protein insertion porin family